MWAPSLRALYREMDATGKKRIPDTRGWWQTAALCLSTLALGATYFLRTVAINLHLIQWFKCATVAYPIKSPVVWV
jgi:hypothetical protein